MLRKFLYTACFTLLSISAIADNKPVEFSLFYKMNNTEIRPALEKSYVASCEKVRPADVCKNDTQKVVNKMIAYATYRMTSEKTTDYYNAMLKCVDQNSHTPECQEYAMYLFKVYEDYERYLTEPGQPIAQDPFSRPKKNQ